MMNCLKSYYIIRHLTSNLLPHYLAKFECSTVELYTIVIHFKSVTSRFYSKYLQKCHEDPKLIIHVA